MDTNSPSVQGFTAPKPPLPSVRKNMERRALADVTNDSPKQLSPSPYHKRNVASHQVRADELEEDGEDALRSQVKSMLQKIGGINKSPMLRRIPYPIAVGGGPFSASPPPLDPLLVGAAPTPWNTPSSSCCSTGLESPNTAGFPSPPTFPCYRNSVMKADAASPYLAIYVDLGTPPQFRPQSSINDAHIMHQTEEKQMVAISPDIKEMIESGKNENLNGTRTLYFDDTDLLNHGAGLMRQSKLSSELEDDDEDGISEWSVLVNVSSPQGDKEAEAEVEVEAEEEDAIPEEAAEAMMMMMMHHQWDDGEEDRDDEEEEEPKNNYSESEVSSYGSEVENEGVCYDSIEDLCRGVREMAMNGEGEGERRKGLPQSEGKHIRFIYNSDNEEEEVIEEECFPNNNNKNNNNNVTVLKGLPAPTGQHVRFTDEECDLGVN